MNKPLQGSLLIIISMCIFAFIGPMIRWINIPTIPLLFFPGVLGTILLFSYLAYKKKLNRLWPKKYKWLLFLTPFLAVINVGSYFQAYKLTSFANVVFLHYTAPIFAALLAPVFLKEKVDKITIISLALSVGGMLLIFSRNGFSMSIATIGALFALLSGLAYGISILAQKKLSMNLDTFVIIFYQYLIAIIWIPFLKTSDYALTTNQIILIVVYTTIISILPSILYMKGIKYVKAQHVGIIAYAEPIAVIALGYFLFNEIPNWLTLSGGALILVSGYLVLRAEAKMR